MTHDWAEAVERAAEHVHYVAGQRFMQGFSSETLAKLKADAARLRTLATALREATELSQHGTDTRSLTQLILTIPEEP